MLHSVATALATKVFPVPTDQKLSLFTATRIVAQQLPLVMQQSQTRQTDRYAGRQTYIQTDIPTEDRQRQTDQAEMQTNTERVLATTAM